MKLLERLKYLSISSRISILLGIIILLTMGIFSTFSLIKQKKDAIVSISNNTGQLSQTVEKILRVSMLNNRRDEISLAVNNIVSGKSIKSVKIINHEGVIKFSSQKSEIDKIIPQSNQLCSSCHNQKKILDKSFKDFNHYRMDSKNNIIFNTLPIYNEPKCYNGVCHSTSEQIQPALNEKIDSNLVSSSPHKASQTILGFIEIEVSIKQIISDLENTRMQLIFLTILFALIASTITYFSIRYLIGKPVKNLVEGTLRVAQGDFNKEIPPGKAELGLLSESFNKMQKQLITTQNQLIESEKLASVGKLSDEIANEINNPLTGIIIYSESLISGIHSDSSDNNDNKKEDYEIIRQEALKIRESIRNILSLTRQEKPDFKITDISQIIKQAISVVEKFSNFRNIKIITSIPKNLPAIPADHSLMEQVFLNLLLISSESMPAGGILNISINYASDKKEMEIVFSDSGKGIPENIIQNIFDSNNTPGLENISHSDQPWEKIGISLTVCKDIIEMHKGSIIINSNESGTPVLIKLPV